MDISEYEVCPAVRVRDEDFGLLFYNLADTRLTFVRCGRSIRIVQGDNGLTRVKIIWAGEKDKERVFKTVGKLIEKGLIIERGNGL